MKPSCFSHSNIQLSSLLRNRAQAIARVAGSESYSDVSGVVLFYQTKNGVIVYAEVSGLPQNDLPCHEEIYAFHIHKGISCSGTMDDPFADSMTHYNPSGCEHPYHAGDMPPLFGNDGFALSLFLTNRFTVNEVIGRTVLIHDHFDDFMTQPSGNSGTKIACGVIRKI